MFSLENLSLHVTQKQITFTSYLTIMDPLMILTALKNHPCNPMTLRFWINHYLYNVNLTINCSKPHPQLWFYHNILGQHAHQPQEKNAKLGIKK